MATESVATSGSEHGLWLNIDQVLSITLNRESQGFPPTLDHCTRINTMIQGLARAARSVMFHAERAEDEFVAQPVEDIADAILFLSQLSNAVQEEVTRA